MKTRAQTVAFIDKQLSAEYEKKEGSRHHYGYQELRELLDFLYGGPPTVEADKLVNPDPLKGW